MTQRRPGLVRDHSLIHLVVFLTGFSFLVYEVSWNRMLSLVLGTTVTASTIVLSTFMAGFGYGALFWGRRAAGRTELGRLLGLLIVGMGLASSLDYFLFHGVVPDFYGRFAARGTAMPDALMLVLSGVLLFLPAFLMGGVFPLASRLAAAADDTVPAILGRLYASETLGSALGGLSAGFLLLGSIGQRSTVFLAVALNLCLGIWILLDRRFSLTAPETGSETEPAQAAAATAPPARRWRKKGRQDSAAARSVRLRAGLLGALVCGFSLLTLQVLWLRMFKIYLTNTSYTFALITSMSILGIFAGSTWFHRRGARREPDPAALTGVIAGMITATALGLLLLVRLPQIFMFPLEGVLGDPVIRVLGLPLLVSMFTVFPPAFFSGYAFPLSCSLFTTSRSGISGDVGLVLMINTIGSVIGPVVAAFVLIPLLGAVLGVVAVILWLAVGGLLIGRGTGTGTGRRALLTGAGAVALVMIILGPDMKILPPSFLKFGREVLFYRETVEGTLSVGRDVGSRTESLYTFVDNSAVIGSSYDAIKVVKMVGHFPFLLGADIKDALVIGFGIGVTTSAIASHPEVEHIECVELVDGLKDAAVFYRQRNRGVMDDPRLHITPGDGRHYLQKTDRKFDLISCDPTHPILGSGNLYTRDYFELCREHLNPGGMVSQYLPLHKLRQQDLLGLMATFREVFPDCTVWLGHYHAVLLGSNAPLDLDFSDWSRKVGELVRDNDFYSEPHHLAATLVLDGPALAALGTGSGINTDDRCYTEFFDTACLDPDNTAANLRFLLENRKAVSGMFTDIGDTALMERFVKGNALLGESLLCALQGDPQGSLAALEQACRANPENQEYPFLIKLNY